MSNDERIQIARIDIPYSNHREDQFRLLQSGGYMALNEEGDKVFRFDTQEQYKSFMDLYPPNVK